MTENVLRYGDFFSGIGCPAMALRKLGIPFDYVFACEIDKNPKKILSSNFEIEHFYDDVTKVTSLPQVDLYVAGFPCQGYSTANTKIKTENHHSYGLWKNAIHGIQMCNPKWFILENVKALTFKTHKHHLKEITNELDKLSNYRYYIQVYNSKDYGTPQSRPRIWFVGWKSDLPVPKKLTPVPLKKTLIDIIDLTLPMKPFSSKSKHINETIEKLIDGIYTDNGQSIGKFAKLTNLNDTEISSCVQVSNPPYIYSIYTDNGHCTGNFTKFSSLNDTEVSSCVNTANFPRIYDLNCSSGKAAHIKPIVLETNGQTSGQMERIRSSDVSYCQTASGGNRIVTISPEQTMFRYYVSSEIEQLFGLQSGDYNHDSISERQWVKCLGNGMDVGFLQCLIKSII